MLNKKAQKLWANKTAYFVTNAGYWLFIYETNQAVPVLVDTICKNDVICQQGGHEMLKSETTSTGRAVSMHAKLFYGVVYVICKSVHYEKIWFL